MAWSIVYRDAVSTGEPTWASTVQPVTFVQGTPDTRSMLGYMTNFNSSLHSLSVSSGNEATLNAMGVTLDPADGYVYNGTSPIASPLSMELTIVDTAEADWLARATAAGVTFAYDFGTQAYYGGSWNSFNFDNHKYNNFDPEEDYWSQCYQSTGDGPAGRCMQIDFPAAQAMNSNAIVLPFDGTWTSASQGIGGTTYYICYRLKIPATGIPRINNGAGTDGAWKHLIIGQYSQNATAPPRQVAPSSLSHVDSTFVMEDEYNTLRVWGYHYPRGQSELQVAYAAPYYFRYQPSYDRGAGFAEEDRYCLYNTAQNGCYKYPLGEWLTVKIRLQTAQYGGGAHPNNRMAVWVARQDATAWTQLWDFTDLIVGDLTAGYPGGLNGLHFTGYQTDRVNAAADFWMKWSQVIVSTQDIALPGVGA